mmetsp:Transcript_24202/g.60583  ORF Transcript_24202/g.60583 Transcript_24202/m.60583 type:complete len:89 (+) Transcript_24202:28-294(+)
MWYQMFMIAVRQVAPYVRPLMNSGVLTRAAVVVTFPIAVVFGVVGLGVESCLRSSEPQLAAPPKWEVADEKMTAALQPRYSIMEEERH